MATANMIQELLKEKGWSKAELARQLGVSTQTVVYWTKGDTVPRGKRLARLSESVVTHNPGFWVRDNPPPSLRPLKKEILIALNSKY